MSPSDTRITWQSHLFGPSGYAEVARNMIRGFHRRGLPVRCVPISGDQKMKIFENRADGGRFEALLDERHSFFDMNVLFDPETLDGILKSTFFPAGGVHIILHPPTDGQGRDFWAAYRRENACHAAHVGFTMFETDRVPELWLPTMNRMDEVWVPTTFGRDVFAAGGVDPALLRVMPLPGDPRVFHPGVTPLTIGRPAAFTFLSIFEWTFRKGWDVLVRAFLEEFGPEEDVRLLIRSYQGAWIERAGGLSIADQFRAFLSKHGLSQSPTRRVEFIDHMVPTAEMPSLYRAADAFVLPSRGEGWGQPYLEALLTGVPVIATRWSGHLDFLDEETADLVDIDGLIDVDPAHVVDKAFWVGHRWADPSVADLRRCLRRVFSDPAAARRRAEEGRRRCVDRYSPEVVADRVVTAAQGIEARRRGRRGPAGGGPVTGNRALKILFQARPDIFRLPGGDTETLLALQRELELRGHRVDFSAHWSGTESFDIVHVFNLNHTHALNLALRATPFVMTPLFEDRRYLDGCRELNRLFHTAFGRRGLGPRALEGRLPLPGRNTERPLPAADRFAGSVPDRLLAVGASEATRLSGAFPETPVDIVPLGLSLPASGGVDPELFADAFAVRDYVLCVGRLEMRKNQLGLLHALRDSDVPVVFVNSRTHQEDYEALCRDYPRRGRTVFTGRISGELLESAYAGALVHALPSFYELPGLVTLEAAARGIPVVAAPDGAILDYLPEGVHLCAPGDPESIRRAVEQALAAGPDPNVAETARGWTWARSVDALENVYADVLTGAESPARRERGARIQALGTSEVERQAGLLEARAMIDAGNSRAALQATSNLESRFPEDAEVLFLAGEAALKSGDFPRALEKLNRCFRLDPRHSVKLQLFTAMAEMAQGRIDAARAALEAGLAAWPNLAPDTEAVYCDYLSRSAAALGDRAAQKQWIDRCVKLVPHNAASVLNRARLQAEEPGGGAALVLSARDYVAAREEQAETRGAGTDAVAAPTEGKTPSTTPDGGAYSLVSRGDQGVAVALVLGVGGSSRLGDLLGAVPASVPVALVEPAADSVLEALSRLDDRAAAGRRFFLVAGAGFPETRQAVMTLHGPGRSSLVFVDPVRVETRPDFFAPLLECLNAGRHHAGGASATVPPGMAGNAKRS